MSDLVKLSGRLPGNTDDNDANGLDDIVDDLIDAPEEIRLGIAWFDVSKITDNTDDKTRIPTVRIRRVEPLNDAAMAKAGQQLGERAHKARTGRAALPGFSDDDGDGD